MGENSVVREFYPKRTNFKILKEVGLTQTERIY